MNHFNYPFDSTNLLRNKRSIRRQLLAGSSFIEKRVAILGGSTTAEVKDMIEIFLLNEGIKATFYESDYNRYFEDIIFQNDRLKNFSPEVIYIHTTSVNIDNYPTLSDKSEDIKKIIAQEIQKFVKLWDRISLEYSCPIIQNNFELPHYRVLGNLDGSDAHGRSHFIAQLNVGFNEEAQQRKDLFINDINYLSAWFGLERWYDKLFWYSYKYAMNIEAIPFLANSISSIIKAIFGKSKKCLVLDLDNTLWGGVIGDDGIGGILIGNETPEAEAYTEFQKYIKQLKERGVILAICSKNDESTALEGLSHPDSILSESDFSEIRANWGLKHENIRNIALKLNIGIDSLVFADDNPFERNIVKAQEPEVSVLELGSNVTKFIDIIDKTGYFETVSLSSEDINRNAYYKSNMERSGFQSHFNSYEEFLHSLDMVAEIRPFVPIYFDRITQLINKTNQFNLTTRRYSFSEIATLSSNPFFVTFYGRLSDKFGDNGIVSVIVGELKGDELHIRLWLMSCRVLKRGMEHAMLDQLVEEAKKRDVKCILGYYVRTNKNNIVSDLYKEFGFEFVQNVDAVTSIWSLNTSNDYLNKNAVIKIDK